MLEQRKHLLPELHIMDDCYFLVFRNGLVLSTHLSHGCQVYDKLILAINSQ